MNTDQFPNKQWAVVTVSQPTVMEIAKAESWILNPMCRYVLNTQRLPELQAHVETISDLKSATHHRALDIRAPLAGASVIIERNRDRGIGDLLFVTGPMAYLQHIAGGTLRMDVYAAADRGQVMLHNPLLRFKTALVGPTYYDTLKHYNAHWFIESVTDYDEEPDQLNVYDALYRQIGVDPDLVEPKFKRPSLTLDAAEMLGLDQLFYMCWVQRKVDLRKTGYYVVAPFTHSALRLMPYQRWLEIIPELAGRRPVVVVGNLHSKLPVTDGMAAGEFSAKLAGLGNNVYNAVDATPLRVLAALLKQASCVFTLDTGTLYIAQALRVPAVSIWGPHDPGVRIGYDPDYMDLAVWTADHCAHAPCFCYRKFPTHKCPRGASQTSCEVFTGVTVTSVLAKLDQVESTARPLGTFHTKS